MNLYAYAGGDPVNRSDPTGLDPDIVVTAHRGRRAPASGDIVVTGRREISYSGILEQRSREQNWADMLEQNRAREAQERAPQVQLAATFTADNGLEELTRRVAPDPWVADDQLPAYARFLRGRRFVDPGTGHVWVVRIPASYRMIGSPRGGGALLVPPGWRPGDRRNIIRFQPAGTGSAHGGRYPSGYFIVYGQNGSALNIRTGQAVPDNAPEAHNPWGGVLPPYLRIF